MGVSKSAVYHHFRTKDELVQRALAPVTDGLRDIIGTPAPVGERIDRLIDLALAHKEVIALCSPGATSRIGEQALCDSHALGKELVHALTPPDTATTQARIRTEVFFAALAAAVNASEDSSDIEELRPSLRNLILL
ncbi:TetR/AcrR family transcriptional regulator [Streptomyces sp. NPDC002886]|uniref:TetR/AcrR family transcriptional regulator n=1 Tax=Streptomyces sp. NPDC002886 TaxID=3364667 RepID=UPI0036823849